MKIYFLSLFLLISGPIFPTNVENISSVEQKIYEADGEIAISTGLVSPTVTNVHKILSDDFLHNVDCLVKERTFFRNLSNYTKITGNSFLYVGSALSTIASGSSLIRPNSVPKLLFSSTFCLSAHVLFIGVARLSAREEMERERLLDSLATRVNFKVTPVTPTVIDDSPSGENAIPSTSTSTPNHQKYQ